MTKLDVHGQNRQGTQKTEEHEHVWCRLGETRYPGKMSIRVLSDMRYSCNQSRCIVINTISNQV